MSYLILSLAGLIFFAGALHGAYMNLRLRRYGRRTTAQVVAVRERTSTDVDDNGFTSTTTTYKAVLRFTTEEGESLQAEELNGGRRPHAEVGQQVTVRYDSRNPNKVQLDTFSGRWNVQALISAAGFTAIILYALVAGLAGG